MQLPPSRSTLAAKLATSLRWLTTPLRTQVHPVVLGMSLLLVLTGLAHQSGFPVFEAPNLDLSVYIEGARRALSGNDAIYDTPPGELPFTYPPFAALVFGLFAAAPGNIATLGLTMLSLAALIGVAYAWIRWTNHFATYNQLAIAGLFAVLGLALQPMQRTLDLGQINILLCWLIVFDIT